MQVVEINESLAAQAGKVAAAENRTLQDFVNLAVRESLWKRNAQRSDEEKIRRFAESYSVTPQDPAECEMWLDEQVWGDE